MQLVVYLYCIVLDRLFTNILFYFLKYKTIGIVILNCWQKEQIDRKMLLNYVAVSKKYVDTKLGTKRGTHNGPTN